MHRITFIALILSAFLGGAKAVGFIDLLPAWSTSQGEAGCGGDPLGCPVEDPQPDAGCIGDPHGDPGCTPGS